MNEKLEKLINEYKTTKQLITFDEAATKQAVILRILSSLGWDPFNVDEIYPEYSVGGKRVDYALRQNGKNKVFIEVKKINEDLEPHQEQLLNYSFQEGVRLAILTNGISWWFYLPLNEGSWEQRKFYTIEIYDQDSNDITEKFEMFLSKDNVISGRAIINAENIYKSRQKLSLIKDTLPEAWEKLIMEPDELLVELLADTTEKLCGHKPDNEVVEQFLMKINQAIVQRGEEPSNLKRPKKEQRYLAKSLVKNYTGKSVVSFIFEGKRYPIQSWKELLIKICKIVLSIHKDQQEKVFNLIGRKRPYFTKNPDELRSPERINDTDIYVETNLSANSIVKLAKSLLTIFGYSNRDLSIETN